MLSPGAFSTISKVQKECEGDTRGGRRQGGKIQSEGLGLHFLVTCRGDAVSSIIATGGVYLYTAAVHVSSTAGKSGN